MLALFPLSIPLSVLFSVPLPVGGSLFFPLFHMILFSVLAAPNSNSYSSSLKRLRFPISLERFCPIPRTSSPSGFRQAQPFYTTQLHNNVVANSPIRSFVMPFCSHLSVYHDFSFYAISYKAIMIPRRSRGFFFDGHSPMLLATCHVTLVRSGTCISLLLAARKRA